MRNIIWLIVLPLAACARVQPRPEVYIAPQLNAPVQIVSITPYRNNLLARVIVKNNTDRYVQDFGITWTVFRPANCTASGRPAPRIASVSKSSVQCYAEDRRWWMLPGHGGNRVLMPHEQTQTTWWLWLTREELAKFSKDYDARKLRVQIGIEHVNYGNKFTNRSGPPDWRDETVERTNIFDAEDATKQTCPTGN